MATRGRVEQRFDTTIGAECERARSVPEGDGVPCLLASVTASLLAALLTVHVQLRALRTILCRRKRAHDEKQHNSGIERSGAMIAQAA
jgi:molybdenum cofactor biosynthesis enzyme MoaA